MAGDGTVEELIAITGEGPAMEGAVTRPAEGEVSASVLLLAPHPLYGGNMDSNVLIGVARRAARDGLAALRFNYRGVDGSGVDLPAGTSPHDYFTAMDKDRNYEALLEDVYDAYRFLQGQVGELPKRTIAGYSLGAAILSMADMNLGATDLVFISPPNTGFSMDALNQCTLPKVFVGGDNDSVFDVDLFEKAYEAFPPPKTFLPLEGVDHFYGGQEERLYDAIRPFLLGEG